jgi:hypothetical protein
MKNILIVDNDLGFILWLGRVLIGAHQQPLPACNVSDAMVLADAANPVDLLIINSSLPHSSEFITKMRRTQSKIKVIALDDEVKERLPHDHAWRSSPGQSGPSAEQKWLKAIKGLLGSRSNAGRGMITPSKRRLVNAI